MRYQIWGYSYADGSTLLEEFDSSSEAINWVDRYTRWGDTGGYDVIDVVDSAATPVVEHSVSHAACE